LEININDFLSKVFKDRLISGMPPSMVIHGRQQEEYDKFFQFDKFMQPEAQALEAAGLHKILSKIFPFDLNFGKVQIVYEEYEIEAITRDISICMKQHHTFGKRAYLRLKLEGQIDIGLMQVFNDTRYYIEWPRKQFEVIPILTEAETFRIRSGTRLNPPVERCPIFNIGIKDDKASDIYNITNLKIYFLSDYLEREIRKRLNYLKFRYANAKKSINPIHVARDVARTISICIYQCLTDPHACPPVTDTNVLSRFSQQREVAHSGPFGLKGNRADINMRHVHHTHYGRLCPLETPESETIGLKLHLSKGVLLKSDGTLFSRYNEWDSMAAENESRKYFGSYFDKARDGEVLARTDDIIWNKRAEEIPYWDRIPGQFMGHGASVIPFIQHDDPVRATMGAKNIKQALELCEPDEPLIKTGIEKELSHGLNIGKNLLVAYMPWYGYNYEDGIVVSEKIVNALSTRKEFKQIVIPVWGNERPYCRLDKIDGFCSLTEDGLVTQGVKVGAGDIVARIHETREFLNEVVVKSNFREERVPTYVEGVVTEAAYESYFDEETRKSPKTLRGSIKIKISSDRELKVGDKLMGRHGNKGVVSKILLEREMPYFHDSNGKKDNKESIEYHGENEKHTHVEIILNPHGVVSRMNLGQLMETHMGLVILRAKKETKEFFDKEWLPFEKVDMERLKEGLKETGIVNEKGKVRLKYFKNGNKIETQNDVVVGYQYIMKLDHMIEDKYHARNTGSNATITGQALKGRGKGGGMRLGEMEIWALQAHGALNSMNELIVEKADDPGKTGYARSMQVFVMYLRGLGVSLDFLDNKGKALQSPKEATKAKISFVDDSQISGWSRGEIKNKKLPKTRTKKASKGEKTEAVFDPKGLFSPDIFGRDEVIRFFKRINNKKDNLFMGHIALVHPVLNPIFASNRNKKEFGELCYEIMKPAHWGIKTWNKRKGSYVATNLVRKKILVVESRSKMIEKGSLIPIDEHENHEKEIKAVDLWELCENKDLAESFNLTESINKLKRYFIKNIPVIPITLRPYLFDKGNFIIGDLNNLYSDIITANERLRSAMKAGLPHAAILIFKEKLELTVNNLFLHGKIDVNGKFVNSISDLLKGKKGLIRQSILGKRCNYSGRSVIVPDPYISMDEIVIPWEIAKILYPEDKEILSMGFGTKILLEDKYVLLTRAPSLHKYSVQAFRPIIENGTNAFKINPSICQGFNADFDGDQMSIFTLQNGESIKEAKEKLIPQRNLISIANGDILPSMSLDIRLGIYLMFNDKGGCELIKEVLGDDVTLGNFERRTKTMIMSVRSKEAKENIEVLLRKAFEYATKFGMSFGMFDLQELDLDENKIKECMKSYWDRYGYENIKMATMNEAEINKYKQIVADAENGIKRYLGIHNESNDGKLRKYKDNPVSVIYFSGAKKDDRQIMQLIGAKGILEYPLAQKTMAPIVSNYFKGLHPFEYFISTYQARSTVMDKKLKTAPCGYLTRRLVSAAYDMTISHKRSCNSKEGLTITLSEDNEDKNRWIIGRCLVEGISKQKISIKRNTVIDKAIFEKIVSFGLTIKIRSPIYCAVKGRGICAPCYGWNLSNEKLPEAGLAIGIIAGQSVGERLTQLAMRSYHTGSTEGAVKDFGYIENGFDGKDLFTVKELSELLEIYNYKVDSKHFEVIMRCMENGKKRISEVALKQESFLSAASFGRLIEVISKAAYKEKVISVNGLKDRLILGRLTHG
jgi:DNA-directed RNA polymerase beta' subunit